jgi:hypothetical protein
MPPSPPFTFTNFRYCFLNLRQQPRQIYAKCVSAAKLTKNIGRTTPFQTALKQNPCKEDATLLVKLWYCCISSEYKNIYSNVTQDTFGSQTALPLVRLLRTQRHSVIALVVNEQVVFLISRLSSHKHWQWNTSSHSSVSTNFYRDTRQ